ncbi:MAG: TIGR00297 family protein [Oscillatoriales cyanobacterium SM2_2_1]|nr:TIGR00297 family protein [Oscillatoriales cyanobacterium SM2_2_1]
MAHPTLSLLITNPWFVAIALNTTLGAIALLLPRIVLTTAGILHAWGLGILVWGCLGVRGYALIVGYLVLGSAVTRIGKDIKTAKGIAEKRDGARGPENLWGSAFTAALCALGYLLSPAPYWWLGYTASLSTKLADTTASEVGKAYGRRTFLITTLQPVPAGTEGAVSLEGTLAGVGGAMAIALLGYSLQVISPTDGVICLLAAQLATTCESILGATLQQRYPWLTNEVVNGINTAIGAATAIGLAHLFINS